MDIALVLDEELVVGAMALVGKDIEVLDETLLDSAACAAAAGHPLFTKQLVFALLTASEPPTPPPIAAATMTTISASSSQNVTARRPKIVCSRFLSSV